VWLARPTTTPLAEDALGGLSNSFRVSVVAYPETALKRLAGGHFQRPAGQGTSATGL